MDYSKFKELQDRVKKLKNKLEKGTEDEKNILSILQFPEGKILELRVKVTDPFVANVVLGSGLREKGCSGIPGMEVMNIRFNDLEHKSEVADKLYEIADQLMKESNQRNTQNEG